MLVGLMAPLEMDNERVMVESYRQDDSTYSYAMRGDQWVRRVFQKVADQEIKQPFLCTPGL